MREITYHKIDNLNELFRVEAVEPSDGQYPENVYQIYFKTHGQWEKGQRIQFHKGSFEESGPNGLTNEVLLTVLIDRLRGLQKKLPCRENDLAVTKLEEALHWLEHRSRDRQKRGVIHTDQP